ncbi:MAG: von Willebrand factor type A domain-containing protein [Clostridia bacterium]|nr:von Willebrand factor type A domain-containing protein [Clostridia bacterium]
MKKNLFTKLLALTFATVMTLSLVSCSGAMKEGFDAPTDNYYGPETPMESLPDGMPPDELYGQLIENEWVNTSEEPTSTFSSDVDTASYSRLRAYLNNNMPFNDLKTYYGASIRTEELLNYFKYTTNSPENGDLFGVRTEIAPCPWNKDASLLMMTFKAKEAETKSKGNNLVFLIDVSGSMNSEDKLPLLQKAFDTLIDSLGSNDRISIVTYSGEEKVVLEGCSGNDKEKIRKAVKKLGAGGSTNGSAGMERAYSIAQDYFIEGGNNRIIMATDGDLNVGITSTEGILDYVEKKRQSGIYISTLGFGMGGYNDSMLETIADNGNGAYYFIDGMTEAEKIFGTDLLSTLYTVAEDVKFQLHFNELAISEYRLVGYENRVMNNEDFENNAKDAGEVGSGQQLVVCYEIKWSHAEVYVENIMSLSVRYKNPGELTALQNDYIIKNDVATEDPSDDFKFASAIIVTAMLLHDSEYIDKEITLDYVKDTLKELELNDFYKEEFRNLIKKLN